MEGSIDDCHNLGTETAAGPFTLLPFDAEIFRALDADAGRLRSVDQGRIHVGVVMGYVSSMRLRRVQDVPLKARESIVRIRREIHK